MKFKSNKGILAIFLAGLIITAAPGAGAHCDSMGGPVIADARAALNEGDVTPVLKWIFAEDEEEIRAAFDRTLAVRVESESARELADLWFFETLVRVHRAGEGAPYTGLKATGAEVEEGIEKADAALADGDGDALVMAMTDALERGIRERLKRTHELSGRADHSVEAGRDYVASYVDYIHYVEGVDEAIVGSGHGHGTPAGEITEDHDSTTRTSTTSDEDIHAEHTTAPGPVEQH